MIKLFGSGGSNVKIDMSELVLGGHSFGSATMTETANQLGDKAQPKALLLMDLWCYPILESIKSK